jgi:hypothetical protein
MMDQQRILRFPPGPGAEGVPNRFSKLPAYKHSQCTFKTFSDEEIKSQAGRESLVGAEILHSEEDDQVSDYKINWPDKFGR